MVESMLESIRGIVFWVSLGGCDWRGKPNSKLTYTDPLIRSFISKIIRKKKVFLNITDAIIIIMT